MIFITIIVSSITFFAGFFVGKFISRLDARAQIARDNAIQIQLDNILLDPEDNKAISEMVSNSYGSEKSKVLDDLTKLVNDAAMDGKTRLYLNGYEHYAISINQRIREYLTQEDIRKYFTKYRVKFMYPVLGYSDIEYIDWS